MPHEHGIGPKRQCTQLIFWALLASSRSNMLLLILLRADNNGSALTALAFRALSARAEFVLALGIVGQSIF